MSYWQIMAGSFSRDYSEEFLKYGMAFVGGIDNVKTLKKVNKDDLVVLKRGMTEIIAVGKVVERNGKCIGNAEEEDDKDKEWLRDYDGWNLPAYCYVEWHQPDVLERTKGLTRRTIDPVHLQHIQEAADRMINLFPAISAPVPEPVRTEDLSNDEMLTDLIRRGLSPSTAEDLTTTLKRVRLLSGYYYNNCNWEDVREHETRTFLIVPLLLALGWSEQQMKIELAVTGGRIDIACFSPAYRRVSKDQANNDNCALIIESKGFSQGLDYAHQQGKQYAESFPKCQVVISSNGYCYKAYKRSQKGSGFEADPSAYLNLLRPKKQYARDPQRVAGGLEMLGYLLPPPWQSGRP